MRKLQLTGLGVALVTPFNADGTIDHNALESVIEHTIAGGVDFLVALGSTGETSMLSSNECRSVIDTIVRVNAARVPLLVGHFGGSNTAEIQERLRNYNFDGIDGIMCSNPSYVKPNQEGIYRHFMAIAEATTLPILIYNVPSRSASNMTAETTLRLAHASPQFIGVKEASDDMQQIMQIIKNKPEHFVLLSGDDYLTLPITSVGGSGLVSVIGNAYPKEFAQLTHAALKGDYATARQLNNLLLDIHPLLFVEGNPTGVKTVLAQLGICEPHVRLPLGPISPAVAAALHREMEKIAAQ